MNGKTDKPRVYSSVPFLFLLPMVFAAASCAPQNVIDLRPDAVPSAKSATVLSGYADGAPQNAPGRPICSLPVPHPPAVVLPGEPDRPWTGAPRNLLRDPAVPVSTQDPSTDGPVVPHPGQTTAHPPFAQRLAAGDAIEVQVERHPEFSGRWTVKPNGLLEIPEGGAFGPPELLPPEEFSLSVGRVAGRQPGEAGSSIGRALRDYVVDPPVVRVTPISRRES